MHRPCGFYIGKDDKQLVYIGELDTRLPVNKDIPNVGARVSIFDLEGNRLARLGDIRRGLGPNQFVSAHSVAVDSRGDIYIGEVSWTAMGSKLSPPRELRSFRKLVKSAAS